MDALINTFKPCSLPAELLNMQRETGERSCSNHPPTLPSISHSPFIISNSNIPQIHDHQNQNVNQIQFKLNSNPFPNSSSSNLNHSRLPIPSHSSSSSTTTTSSFKLSSIPNSSIPRPLQLSHQSSNYNQPNSSVTEIPSIHQIVEKYSYQITHSSIPLHTSSSSSIRQHYSSTKTNPPNTTPLKPSSNHQFPSKSYHHHSSQIKSVSPPPPHLQSNDSIESNHQENNCSSQKSRLKSLTNPCENVSDDESVSFIHPLTKEALKLPKLPDLNFDSSSSSSSSQFTSQSTTSLELKLNTQKQKLDSDSISKISSGPNSSNREFDPPSPASNHPETDNYIVQYLRSSRLTTLIKLKRQQSPMTVSLADVGSSTGRPVIVYLGLGCVRYLVGLYDELAEALGLRLICIDRWGLGKTTEVPDDHRTFTEWASVVEEVVDQLGVEKFSILAHSAGAPYALASSLRFGDRINGTIHLLAPWVSMTAEGGIDAGAYKWLRYVPNSMIKTVQAAEWKMTGWRLGKLPKLNYPPVGFDARSPTSTNYQPLNQNSSTLSDPSSDLLQIKNNHLVKSSKTNNLGHSHDNNHRTGHENSKIKTTFPTSTTTNADGSSSNNNTIRRRMTEDPESYHIPHQSLDDLCTLIDQPDGVLMEIENKKSLLLTSDHQLGLKKLFKYSSNFQTSPCSSDQIDPQQHQTWVRSSSPSSINAAAKKTATSKITSRKTSEDSWLNLSHPINRSSSDSHQSQNDSSNTKSSSHLSRTCNTSSNGSDHHLPLLANNDTRSSRNPRIKMQKMENTLNESKNKNKAVNDSPQQGSHEQRKIKNSTSSSIASTRSTNESPKETGIGGIRRTLGISLLRASYSESLKGGASDLITILEKDSKKKPWGFKYSEIQKPVKIWHGDKDEKLSCKGSEFFLNSILLDQVRKHSKLFIVKDANHSLMTNVNVLFQVFESIADEWTLPSSNP